MRPPPTCVAIKWEKKEGDTSVFFMIIELFLILHISTTFWQSYILDTLRLPHHIPEGICPPSLVSSGRIDLGIHQPSPVIQVDLQRVVDLKSALAVELSAGLAGMDPTKHPLLVRTVRTQLDQGRANASALVVGVHIKPDNVHAPDTVGHDPVLKVGKVRAGVLLQTSNTVKGGVVGLGIILPYRLAGLLNGTGLWLWRIKAEAPDAEAYNLTGLVVDNLGGYDPVFGQAEPVLDAFAHATGVVVRIRGMGGLEHGVSVFIEGGATDGTYAGDVGFDDGTK